MMRYKITKSELEKVKEHPLYKFIILYLAFKVLEEVYNTRISDEDKRLCGEEIWEQWLGEMHEVKWQEV